MAAVLTALVVGMLFGLVARPLLDAYLKWKTAELYRRLDNAPSHDVATVRLRRSTR